ncbi:hypothetical protein H6G89_23685 [Oscillatoria sp. FACHB-1407]|uniref:hypothetical protein n=1 Tax=Oscillatoria sp. FACHB-1407 TaxID=2692847 RepID=UPI001685C49B|nr:hypothetical protein [Oscillatoria sp. FACHB-1407]MBD2464008.1 hypothetical protein [Oscillatoria sp. FACHB-1407]
MSYQTAQQLAQYPLNLVGICHRQLDWRGLLVGIGFSSFSDRIGSTESPIQLGGMANSALFLKKPALRGQSGRYRFRTAVPI